ncbi:NAD(P)-binding protein [Xylona heveae TC161]|uniref:NAD(P)-binding protein n=1 Tax=Xylona heveae (strain CBS 132557 / TC161) TaxID=1328760 RepID=A0A165FK99_XYLHT|nr:NAD(P)-binding protein [Xylona heveae TC161]KZF21077.1 NAD(P)-binding protein [Xylona heveae TC161]
MFSLRSVTGRLATVAVRQPAIRTVAPAARAFSVTFKRMQEEVHEKGIPVHSYTDKESSAPEEKVLPVGATSEVVGGGQGDVKIIAQALDKSIAEKLSPTLSKFTLVGKVAAITGGGRGLGYNMAQALSEVGVKAIAILDIQQEVGDAAAAELHEHTGVPVRFYKVDVRDGPAIAEVFSDVVDSFGSIDVVINAAGIADSNIKAEDYDHVMFRRLIDINVTGSFLVAQAAGRAMIKAGTGGSIVNIASMSGSVVNYPQEQCCYNASKAAVIQLTKSLAAEWAQHKIRVNSISPGYMDTALNRVPALDAQKKIWKSLTPQRRLGNVDELNNLAVFLASDASTFMTGSNCIIDGGYSVL